MFRWTLHNQAITDPVDHKWPIANPLPWNLGAMGWWHSHFDVLLGIDKIGEWIALTYHSPLFAAIDCSTTVISTKKEVTAVKVGKGHLVISSGHPTPFVPHVTCSSMHFSNRDFPLTRQWPRRHSPRWQWRKHPPLQIHFTVHLQLWCFQRWDLTKLLILFVGLMHHATIQSEMDTWPGTIVNYCC